MAEDSGAFKTNPRNSAQIGHFVIACERLRQRYRIAGKCFPAPDLAGPLAYFVTNSFEALRYSRIGLIRGVCETGCVVTASLQASNGR
jgi:hypothetical protein